jgi:hypothetical protein
MPSNDREVWVAILSEGTGPKELLYLAYAIYSFEKYEWYNKIERDRGEPPTAKEIDEWISQITESRIRGWRDNAGRAFDAVAQDYMKVQLTRNRQDIIDSHVINSVESNLGQYSRQFHQCLTELRKSSSFGKQLAIGVFIAIMSPIILGLIILAVEAADLWPTPTGITHLVHPQPSEGHARLP